MRRAWKPALNLLLLHRVPPLLYKCSVFPHCCPFYLLILADLLLSFDSLGEKEVPVTFFACAIFVELDIFVAELNIVSNYS